MTAQWRHCRRTDGHPMYEEFPQMASSTQRDNFQFTSLGRSFVSADPERQREVIGYVRGGSIGTAPPTAAASERAARTARVGWMRVQPDVDSSTFEGSSSRRSR
jgi:hypothetical protein